MEETDLTLACASRAGELSADELESLMAIVANPKNFKIPNWFLNRQKDFKDGSFSQITSSALDSKLREDLERLKKIRYIVSTMDPLHALSALVAVALSLLSSCQLQAAPLLRLADSCHGCIFLAVGMH